MTKQNEHKNIPELRFPEFKDDGEWERKELGKLGHLIGGGTPDRSISAYWTGSTPWISSSDIIEDNIHDICISRFINESAIKESATKIVPKGSVLFVSRVGVGKLAVNQEELCTSQDFTSFTPKYVLNYFVGYYFMANKSLLKSMGQGTSIRGFSKNDLECTKLSFPKSSLEQKKIADCLSSLDEVITAHSDKLKVLKDHKKGLMQVLFPQEGETAPKYRFKEFKDDGEWEEKRLGDVTDISKLAGYEFTKHITYEETGKIIALRGLNVKNGSLELSEVKYIDNSELPKLSRSKLYINDLMFTYIGTIGEVALVPENNKYYLGPNVARIRIVKECVEANYLFQYFNIPQFKNVEIKKYISSSSQPALTMGNVRKFLVKIPKIDEQQKIADALSSLDDLITAQSEKIEQLKAHKKGLMQKLFPAINE